MTALIGPSSLVQGPTRSVQGVRGLVAPRRLDAVVGTPEAGGFVLHHYQRPQDRPDRGWSRISTVSTAAVGPGALASWAGHLEVLVPEPAGVVHYRGANQGSWSRRQLVTCGDAVSLAATPTGLVALIDGPDGVGTWLFDGRWRAGAGLPGIAGAVAANDRAVRAVVVQGDDLVWCELHEGAWITRRRVTAPGTAPASLAWGRDGWLLAVPRQDVVETWRLQDDRWLRAEVLTWGAGDLGGVSLAASRLHGWVQALTDEEGSVFHHHRQARRSEAVRWMRSACLRLHDPQPFVLDPHESVKLAQLSGELDSQPTPWGERRPTLSRSVTSAGIRGTDLGVRVDHAGETFLLFGDTHWSRPWLTTRDAIARVTPRGPLPGLPGVEFHGSPLKVVGGPATMREYDVPLDGFSHAGQFFAFFSSHHFEREQTMGRSLLARALDPALPVDPRARRRPLRFRQLTTFSTRHFINVSVQLLPATAVPGFDGDHDLLLVWGSGAYRAGDLRLAVLDPSAARVARALAGHRRVEVSALGLRYWAGLDGATARWVEDEEAARPLLHPGAFGEISVRWVPEVGRFLLLSGAGPEDPMGPAITLRTATAPWGPWSPRRRLLDWVATGMSHHDPFSRFIRATADGNDPVGDSVFKAQAEMTGAAYAPYVFDAERDGDDLVLRYTLSTWNPYQVVLMRHRLAVADLSAR